jgi:hypothetical protein
VNAILEERIGERVSALKISWRRASLEAGLEVGFIQDIITGRSKHPGEDAVASLATVLKCSWCCRGSSCDRSCSRHGPATRCRHGAQNR